MLSDPDVKKHLEEFHQKIVIITIDKASNNFLFIFRKCYVSKLLTEFSPNKKKPTTQQPSIQKHKSLKRNLLKLTLNPARKITLK